MILTCILNIEAFYVVIGYTYWIHIELKMHKCVIFIEILTDIIYSGFLLMPKRVKML